VLVANGDSLIHMFWSYSLHTKQFNG